MPGPDRKTPRARREKESPVTLLGSESDVRKTRTAAEGHEQVAPTIGKWVAACFPGGMVSTDAQIHALVKEAADAARSDYGVESALAWADGYAFPPSAIESGTACLMVAGFNIEVVVRERLGTLSADRLSAERVERLRMDNPERDLLFNLIIGM